MNGDLMKKRNDSPNPRKHMKNRAMNLYGDLRGLQTADPRHPDSGGKESVLWASLSAVFI